MAFGGGGYHGGGGFGRYLASSYLPPNLLQLFAARPPIPPVPSKPHRKPPPMTGIAQLLSQLESREEYEARPKDTTVPESKQKQIDKKRKERDDRAKEELAEKEARWDPNSDPKIEGNSYKTLFVSRMSYLTDEHKLKREMEAFGPVKRVRLVYDQDERPRGYGFVEFEHEKDMRTAFKQADGLKIDGRRILVDVERGRTVKDWKPRRLGGGLGSTRTGQAAEKGYRPPKPITSSSVTYDDRRSSAPPSRGRDDDRRNDRDR